MFIDILPGCSPDALNESELKTLRILVRNHLAHQAPEKNKPYYRKLVKKLEKRMKKPEIDSMLTDEQIALLRKLSVHYMNFDTHMNAAQKEFRAVKEIMTELDSTIS